MTQQKLEFRHAFHICEQKDLKQILSNRKSSSVLPCVFEALKSDLRRSGVLLHVSGDVGEAGVSNYKIENVILVKDAISPVGLFESVYPLSSLTASECSGFMEAMKQAPSLLEEGKILVPSYGDSERKHLPQITDFDSFVADLQANGIEVDRNHLAAMGDIRSMQSEYDEDKVVKLMGSVDAKPIVISKDNYIVDGHHRWLAKYNLGDRHIKAVRIGCDADDLLKFLSDKDYVKSRDLNEGAAQEYLHIVTSKLPKVSKALQDFEHLNKSTGKHDDSVSRAARMHGLSPRFLMTVVTSLKKHGLIQEAYKISVFSGAHDEQSAFFVAKDKAKPGFSHYLLIHKETGEIAGRRLVSHGFDEDAPYTPDEKFYHKHGLDSKIALDSTYDEHSRLDRIFSERGVKPPLTEAYIFDHSSVNSDTPFFIVKEPKDDIGATVRWSLFHRKSGNLVGYRDVSPSNKPSRYIPHHPFYEKNGLNHYHINSASVYSEYTRLCGVFRHERGEDSDSLTEQYHAPLAPAEDVEANDGDNYRSPVIRHEPGKWSLLTHKGDLLTAPSVVCKHLESTEFPDDLHVGHTLDHLETHIPLKDRDEDVKHFLGAMRTLSEKSSSTMDAYRSYVKEKSALFDDHDWSKDHDIADALEAYTGDSSRVNKPLFREDFYAQDFTGDLTDSLKTQIHHIDRAIYSKKSPETFHVYAGIGFDPEETFTTSHKMMYLPAYTSTSIRSVKAGDFATSQISRKGATSYHTMRIKVPKGHPLAYLERHTRHNNEQEVLLPRGMYIRLKGKHRDVTNPKNVLWDVEIAHTPKQPAPPVAFKLPRLDEHFEGSIIPAKSIDKNERLKRVLPHSFWRDHANIMHWNDHEGKGHKVPDEVASYITANRTLDAHSRTDKLVDELSKHSEEPDSKAFLKKMRTSTETHGTDYAEHSNYISKLHRQLHEHYGHPADKVAIWRYTSYSGGINGYHAGFNKNKFETPFYNKISDQLDKQLASHEAPHDFETYSGLAFDPASGFGKSHKTLHLPAYTSTSISSRQTRQYAVSQGPADKHGRRHILKITVPQGHPGFYIGDHSHHPNEKEFLLPRNVHLRLKDTYYHAEDPSFKVWDTEIVQVHHQKEKLDEAYEVHPYYANLKHVHVVEDEDTGNVIAIHRKSGDIISRRPGGVGTDPIHSEKFFKKHNIPFDSETSFSWAVRNVEDHFEKLNEAMYVDFESKHFTSMFDNQEDKIYLVHSQTGEIAGHKSMSGADADARFVPREAFYKKHHIALRHYGTSLFPEMYRLDRHFDRGLNEAMEEYEPSYLSTNKVTVFATKVRGITRHFTYVHNKTGDIIAASNDKGVTYNQKVVEKLGLKIPSPEHYPNGRAQWLDDNLKEGLRNIETGKHFLLSTDYQNGEADKATWYVVHQTSGDIVASQTLEGGPGNFHAVYKPNHKFYKKHNIKARPEIKYALDEFDRLERMWRHQGLDESYKQYLPHLNHVSIFGQEDPSKAWHIVHASSGDLIGKVLEMDPCTGYSPMHLNSSFFEKHGIQCPHWMKHYKLQHVFELDRIIGEATKPAVLDESTREHHLFSRLNHITGYIDDNKDVYLVHRASGDIVASRAYMGNNAAKSEKTYDWTYHRKFFEDRGLKVPETTPQIPMELDGAIAELNLNESYTAIMGGRLDHTHVFSDRETDQNLATWYVIHKESGDLIAKVHPNPEPTPAPMTWNPKFRHAAAISHIAKVNPVLDMHALEDVDRVMGTIKAKLDEQYHQPLIPSKMVERRMKEQDHLGAGFYQIHAKDLSRRTVPMFQSSGQHTEVPNDMWLALNIGYKGHNANPLQGNTSRILSLVKQVALDRPTDENSKFLDKISSRYATGTDEYDSAMKKMLKNESLLSDHHFSNIEQEHIKEYTSQSHQTNNVLFRGQEIPEGLKEHIKRLDGISLKHQIPKDMTVFSGIGFDPDVEFAKNGYLKLPAFTSSSIDPKEAHTFAYSKASVMPRRRQKSMLMINLPKGHPAAYIEEYSNNQGERELLLPRGVILKLRKTHRSKLDNTTKIWECDALPHGELEKPREIK